METKVLGVIIVRALLLIRHYTRTLACTMRLVQNLDIDYRRNIKRFLIVQKLYTVYICIFTVFTASPRRQIKKKKQYTTTL